MKHRYLVFLLMMISIILVGCKSEQSVETIKNGTYIMEGKEVDAVLFPSITISDNEFTFVYDLLSSYMPRGTYSIEDDLLMMTTDDKQYTYVFEIDGDNFIFQEDKSSLVSLIDDRLGVKITDQASFHQVENIK